MSHTLEHLLFKENDPQPSVGKIKGYLSSYLKKLNPIVTVPILLYLLASAACGGGTTPVATPIPTPFQAQRPAPEATPTPTHTPSPRIRVFPTPTPRSVPVPIARTRDLAIENLRAYRSKEFQRTISFEVFNNGYGAAEEVPFTVTIDGEDQNIDCPNYASRTIPQIPARRSVAIACIYPNSEYKLDFKVKASVSSEDDNKANNQREIPVSTQYGIKISGPSKGKIKGINQINGSNEFVFELNTTVTNTGEVSVKSSKVDFFAITEVGYKPICDPNSIGSIEGLKPGESKSISCTTLPIGSPLVASQPFFGDLYATVTLTGLPGDETKKLAEQSFAVKNVKLLAAAEVTQHLPFHIYHPQSAYQSFRPFRDAYLVRVDVPLVQSGNPIGTPTLEIRSDNGNMPGEIIKYKDGRGRELPATASVIQIGSAFYANFAGVPLEAGKIYWMRMECIPCTGLNNYGWPHSLIDIYGEGSSSLDASRKRDFAFRAYGVER